MASQLPVTGLGPQHRQQLKNKIKQTFKDNIDTYNIDLLDLFLEVSAKVKT